MGGKESEKAMDKTHSSEDIKFQIWKESTETLMSSMDENSFQPFSIGIVPDELRKWNEKAYIPKVISMGPRYKGATRNLLPMEQVKWNCMTILFYRLVEASKTGMVLDDCMTAILSNDVTVRGSYTDEIKLDRYELGATMLNDGCFLLYHLFGQIKELQEELTHYLIVHTRGNFTIEENLTDLLLLENQIPLVILKVLATRILAGARGVTFEKLVRSLLGMSLDSSFDTNLDDHAGHFLELVYVSIFENSQVRKNQDSHHSDNVARIKLTTDEEPRDVDVKLNRCATKLQAAGVTITLKEEKSEDIIFTNLTFIAIFHFDIEFNNGKLEIPRLHITERAEARWCNYIAWEHHKMKRIFITKPGADVHLYNYKCKCTMAALLFNGLICCASDVQLLKDKRIIVDHSNMSNQDLVDFFSSIPKGVDPSIIHSSYVTMFHDLNTYSATPYVTRIPMILWHYLTRIPEVIYNVRRFLRKGYNFVAAILSVLTVIQTVYTILTYYDPKN